MSVAERLEHEITRLGVSRVATQLAVARNTVYGWIQKENVPLNKLVALGEMGADVLYIVSGQRAEPDWDLLELLETGIDEALRSRNKRLPVEKRIKLLKVLYRHYSEQQKKDPQDFERFLEAVMAAI